MIARLRHRWRSWRSPSYRAEAAGRAFLDGWIAGQARVAADVARMRADGWGEEDIRQEFLRRVVAFPDEHPETWAMIERSAATLEWRDP